MVNLQKLRSKPAFFVAIYAFFAGPFFDQLVVTGESDLLRPPVTGAWGRFIGTCGQQADQELGSSADAINKKNWSPTKIGWPWASEMQHEPWYIVTVELTQTFFKEIMMD